jgi:hypothetical protein
MIKMAYWVIDILKPIFAVWLTTISIRIVFQMVKGELEFPTFGHEEKEEEEDDGYVEEQVGDRMIRYKEVK